MIVDLNDSSYENNLTTPVDDHTQIRILGQKLEEQLNIMNEEFSQDSII
jgi:hypothetical protein